MSVTGQAEVNGRISALLNIRMLGISCSMNMLKYPYEYEQHILDSMSLNKFIKKNTVSNDLEVLQSFADPEHMGSYYS